MEAIYIHGGIALQGQLKIQGSKNAVLPVMAATLLTKESCELNNCPRLTDVYHMQSILESLGAFVTRDKDKLKINPAEVDILHAMSGLPKDAVGAMRSSIILLGALLGRNGEVVLEYPGGCVIGKRPIDQHIEALKKLNVVFEEKSYGLYARTNGLKGADITLKMPSVGATENSILAAVCAKGTTVILGAAKEPEIISLCTFLNACGADISGAGSGRIVIKGVESLHGTSFTIPGDRIVAGTYLCACMIARGEILLKGAPVNQMQSVLACAKSMGVQCQTLEEGLYVQVTEKLTAPKEIITGPYPEFPTDMQSLFLPVLATAKGTCRVEERVFENRFHIIPKLVQMGADIVKTDQKHCVVNGVEDLRGYTVSACELRGGAALVIAGAGAKGETIVDGCRYIERGYENICRDLRKLGVRIYSI